jgi:hypothetical protein
MRELGILRSIRWQDKVGDKWGTKQRLKGPKGPKDCAPPGFGNEAKRRVKGEKGVKILRPTAGIREVFNP